MTFSSSSACGAESNFGIPAARPSDGTENPTPRLDESGFVEHPTSISCSEHGLIQKVDQGSDPCTSDRNIDDKTYQSGDCVDSSNNACSQISHPADKLTSFEQPESDCSMTNGPLPCIEACSSSKLEIRIECPPKAFGKSSRSITAVLAGETSDNQSLGSEVKNQQDSVGRETEQSISQLPGQLNHVADLECRVCHSSLGVQSDCGEAMQLGCACKDDLAVAHRRCAEAWFKIKGNRICEVCGVNAANVVGIKDVEFMKKFQGADSNSVERRNARWWNRMPICNLLISLIIAAIILPWLFHVNLFG